MIAFLNMKVPRTIRYNINDHLAVKIIQRSLIKILKNWLKNTFKVSNNDINQFILLLKKCVYTDEYMDEWEKFNEISLPAKEEFYSNLNMEDIIDADYIYRKKMFVKTLK